MNQFIDDETDPSDISTALQEAWKEIEKKYPDVDFATMKEMRTPR